MNNIICSDNDERITVIITGESKAYFERQVEMRKSDYEKYLSLIESDSMSCYELEKEIAGIACKYGFDDGSLCHTDLPEDIEFNPCSE